MAATPPGKIYGVSELTRHIKHVLGQAFPPFWLRGEISECRIHSNSSHVYFTLKDSGAQISAVFFRGGRIFQDLRLGPGVEVDVYGQLTVYEPNGNYQVLVSNINVHGLGDLHRRFEEMKQRLQAEGLFDPQRKRPIPPMPNCVGVITSRDGAALQDFLNVLHRRFAGMRVRIAPTLVQGSDAARQIAAAIAYLNNTAACDVIVVTRGGGGLEDLWPFNEEAVARAIAGSAIPVISAVGHERDFTICDFAADHRSATPSVAAEQVVEAKARLHERIVHARQRLRNALLLRLANLRQRQVQAAACPLFSRPEELLNRRAQQLDYLVQRLAQAIPRQAEQAALRTQAVANRLARTMPAILQARQARLENARRALHALNPTAVLTRGYSILLTENGRAIRSAKDTSADADLLALLGNGKLNVKVTKIIPKENNHD